MNKKVVYTCLVGRYDDLKDPLFVAPDWDYLCFTDKPERKKSKIWKFVKIEERELKDKIRVSRAPKLLPHEYLQGYEYSIYIDANIQVLDNKLQKRAEELINKKCILSIAKHPERSCVYQEALACIDLRKERPEDINRQMEEYRKINFPEDFGLFENNIIFREHNKLIRLSNLWWEMYNKYSRRDQLSLVVCLWELDVPCEILFSEDFNVRTDSSFTLFNHKEKLIKKIKKRLSRIFRQLNS